MIAFVAYVHHAIAQPRFMRCLNRSSWTGCSKISYQTNHICGRSFIRWAVPSQSESKETFRTPLAMFSGGGGILGVGPSEIVVILAVGWLLLGPKKLFSLAKDSGRLLGELRRTADEAKDSFNDAMELDLIAAEFEEGKRAVQQNGTPDAPSDDKVKNKSGDQSETLEDATSDNMRQEDQEMEVEPESNSAFLEQLQRAADPNQKPPSEVPDLDSDLEEELEVKRLEQQYLDARERLEKRKRKGEEKNTTESESVVGER